MPGDKIEIGEDHINKANLIFRELLGQIRELKKEDADRKIVLTVCGGSGVGKSETASLLSFYFNQIGMKAYTLSGDNYPHRIPKYNDAERSRPCSTIFSISTTCVIIHDSCNLVKHFYLTNGTFLQFLLQELCPGSDFPSKD